MLAAVFANDSVTWTRIWNLLPPALGETLYMVGWSLGLSALLGIPLGMILVVTRAKSILPNTPLNLILSGLVNITRSVPFIILMVAIIPLTRLLVGSSIGTTAAIVPLTLAAIPFVARVTEAAVSEVDQGCIEAALAMGASRLQVVTKVLLSEGLPGLVRGLTITAVNLTSYSAMAGVLGGGGLGNLAIRYGYQRRETAILVATIFVLVVLVQVIQAVGNRLAEALSK